MKQPANSTKLRLLLPLVCVAALVAGCGSGGGGGAKLAASDVAVVGKSHVTLDAFNSALTEEKSSLKAQGQAVPKAGSTNYAAFKDQVVALLVQQAEFGQEATKLGVAVSTKDVDTQLTKLKKKYFKGNEKLYQAQLKKQGFTDAEVRTNVYEQLLEQRLYNAVTKAAKASDADVAAYYTANISQYRVPASRDVREILVGKNKEQLAKQIYSKLKAGGSFAALAKQYSQDPGSKNTGGKFTAKQGNDVPEFDAAVFAKTSKTGQLLQPVKTAQYGWFVIQPLGAIKPAKVTSEKSVAASIRKQLNTTKQNQAMTDWVTATSKSYCTGDKIKYQAAYTPTSDPCAALTTSNATTT